MRNQKFELEEFPFSLLSEVGLTPRMIKDLPQTVIDKVASGEPSPLLSMRLQRPYGYREFSARFRLQRQSDNSVTAVFLPKIKSVNSKSLSYYNKEKLAGGNAIVATVSLPTKNEAGMTCFFPEKCFVQRDPDTNILLCVPSQPIARNIRTLMSDRNLDSEVLERIVKGEVVTIKEDGGDITFGVDLRSSTSLKVVVGNLEDWKKSFGMPLQKYTFGTEGCWVNDHGHMSYVEEKAYTMDIIEAQRAAGYTYRPALEEEEDENREKREEENEKRREAVSRLRTI